MFRLKSFAIPAVAASAFLAVLAVFAVSVLGFREAVISWARRDLAARAEIAARQLSEPLRTQDFSAVRAFGDECRAQGYRLVVSSQSGGLVFYNRPKGRELEYTADSSSADCRVTLAIPVDTVLAPFSRALPLLLLSALLGVIGSVFFFFAFYRQRAKIRELARIEEERRHFVADFSHELKTPLTGILGAAEMLTADNAEKLVPMIGRETTRLNSLAQQILDLSRLEAGGDDGQRNERIERAVAELVANAKRHSGSDEVTVREEDVDGMHRWIVEDRGKGVPPELRERIFERFYRVDPSRSDLTGGAGLGLAIVRRTARLYGGDCVCEDASPHGARFVFSVSSFNGMYENK